MIRFWQYFYPYGIFRIKSQVGKTAYLTFDDGPIPEVTPKVLDILSRYGVKATFFMVGENIDKHPDVFAEVLSAGHSIGTHTYNHLKGIKFSQREYLDNVEKCRDAVLRHLPDGSPMPDTFLFRPPYGKAWLWQRAALHRRGFRLIYWDVLTRDYSAQRTPEAMLSLIKRATRNGSIINFHDSLKSNERMLAVLPQAIEWLQSEGYELKSL